jgi:PAS domain S-box-containing protein
MGMGGSPRIENAGELSSLAVLKSAPGGVLLIREGKVGWANANAISLLHAQGAEQLLGQPIERFFPEEGEWVARTCSQPSSVEEAMAWREVTLRRTDGSLFQVEVITFRADLDHLSECFLVMRDDSAQLQAMRALEEKEAHLEAFFQAASNVAFILVNTQGRIQEFSPGAERIFGDPREEILGQPISRLFPPGSPGLGEMQMNVEGFLLRNTGEEFPALYNVFPLRDSKGAAEGVVLVAIDIVRRHQAETRLAQRAEGERLIATVSSRLLNTPPQEVGQAVQEALVLLRDDCRSESAFFRLLSTDGRFFLPQSPEYFAGIEGGTVEILPEIELDEIPWTAAKFRNREIIDIPFVEGLPAEASAEAKIMRHLGIRAALGVPIFQGGSLFAWIGLNQYSKERSWDSETATLVRIVGQAIASTLVRAWGEESLRQSEMQYRTTIEGLEDPLLVVDQDLRILLSNNAFLHMQQEWGGEADVVGKEASQVFPFTGDLDRVQFRQVMESGKPLENLTHLHRQGKEGIYLLKRFPIHDGGEITRVVTLFQDVTAGTLAEQTLRESEEQSRTILESSPDGILLFELNGKIVLANQEAARMHGFFGPHALIGLPFYDLVVPGDVARISKIQKQAEKKALSTTLETTMQRQDGSTFPGELKLSLIRDTLGAPKTILCIARDISDRKRAEEELQSISRRFLADQEMERRRIARELHDQIGQGLSAVKINLQNALTVPLSGDQRGILKETVQTIDQAIDEVRRLSLELRPAALDDLGLVPALRGYLDRTARRSNLPSHFVVEPPDIHLPPELETVCFRIAQEALTNVIRHAEAHLVEVEIRREGDTLLLVVRDDGRGFDLGRSMEASFHGESLGLVGMRERALLARGNLEIIARPGKGTEVKVTLPIVESASRRRRRK